jgi:kynurenine 3-monooxygenase
VKKLLADSTVQVNGRRIHDHGGSGSHFVSWGGDSIKAVDRLMFHQQLIQLAEEEPKVNFHFRQEVVGVNMRERKLRVASAVNRGRKNVKAAGPALGIRDGCDHSDHKGEGEEASEYEYDLLVGADGAFSTIRQQMLLQCPEISCQESVDPVVYKWLGVSNADPAKASLASTIEGSEAGPLHASGLQLDPSCINLLPTPHGITVHALPTPTGGYNLTFMLQAAGGSPYSIESVNSLEAAKAMFAHAVPGLLALDHSLPEQFFANPVGEFRTVSPTQYHDTAIGGGCAILIGDAAHAMPPYFGQAMNIALEDAAVLGAMVKSIDPLGTDGLDAERLDPVRKLLRQFSAERIEEARACQEMTAQQREWILHDSRSPLKRLQQEYQKVMHSLLPSYYSPTARSMVNRHGMRYQDAWAQQQRQNRWWNLGRVYE